MLRVIAEVISTAISTSKHHQPARQSIAFVRAGEKPQQHRSQAGGLLATARDWQLKVDLGRQLKFPENIAVTTLRPDMVLVSETLLELTVPWEDRMEEAFERKRAKCEELAGECRSRGWRTRCNPIEVGCRGFIGQSLIRALKMLGVKGLHNRPHKLLRHKPGRDQPRLGRLGEGV